MMRIRQDLLEWADLIHCLGHSLASVTLILVLRRSIPAHKEAARPNISNEGVEVVVVVQDTYK